MDIYGRVEDRQADENEYSADGSTKIILDEPKILLSVPCNRRLVLKPSPEQRIVTKIDNPNLILIFLFPFKFHRRAYLFQVM